MVIPVSWRVWAIHITWEHRERLARGAWRPTIPADVGTLHNGLRRFADAFDREQADRELQASFGAANYVEVPSQGRARNEISSGFVHYNRAVIQLHHHGDVCALDERKRFEQRGQMTKVHRARGRNLKHSSNTYNSLSRVCGERIDLGHHVVFVHRITGRCSNEILETTSPSQNVKVQP